MATEVYITNKAQEAMASTGLLSAIVNGYYGITDYNKLYSVTGNTIPTVEATGTKTILTNNKCSLPKCNLSGISIVPRTTSVEDANNSRGLLSFMASEGCDGALYTLSGDTNIIDVTVNIGTYINNITDLLAAPYSSASRGQYIPIWNHMATTIQKRDLVNKVWVYEETLTKFNIAWKFDSKEDLNNWKKLNYFYYNKVGALESVKQGDGIFPSSLQPSTTNYINGGTVVQGSGLAFTIGPSWYFYRLIDKNNKIIDTKTLKEGQNLVNQYGTEFYKAIIPGAYVDGPNKKYFMKSTTQYPTNNFDKTWGQLYSWESDEREQLGLGLCQALVLFFKTNGVFNRTTGTYDIHTNFRIDTKASSSYNIMEIIGGEAKIKWSWDPTSTNSDITNIINFN